MPEQNNTIPSLGKAIDSLIQHGEPKSEALELVKIISQQEPDVCEKAIRLICEGQIEKFQTYFFILRMAGQLHPKREIIEEDYETPDSYDLMADAEEAHGCNEVTS